MSRDGQPLISAKHEEILNKKILSAPEFLNATEQSNPKAIILAGQPGAGKGRLADAAKSELRKDVLIIDPDELRKYHPSVDTFRQAHPYTWSGDTHPDASKWAQELRAAAVDGKKNIIIDTTLGSGKSAVDTIKELQAKGYEVEIRAVAAHRLESELGVDKRFADKLSVDGYGRHVPEEVRTKVYNALPDNLDLVQKETGIPIRIFNREGVELYDSRKDTRLPGVVLEEAREARLKDPAITRGLRDGWKEQQTWHRELPETLPQNSKVAPLTRENLLAERSTGNVVEGIERGAKDAVDIDHTTRIRPNRISAGRALGIAGLALDAYDAADTYGTVSRHRAVGNDTAADSEVMHFGARTVGAWGGAAIGAGAGALAGVETGPGLLITGAIGGIGGVFLGDEYAKWIDNRSIYRQDDRQGNIWTHDPENAALGWQRKEYIDNTLDDIDNLRSGMLRAGPELSNKLNYQATSTSAELILGSPPVPRDPFVISADKNDTPSFSPANWTRNPDNGQWQRDVVLAFAERGLSPKRPEFADPERAAELDRASATVVLQNTANSPAMIAARYEATYVQNNWVAHGEIPSALRDARTDVDSLMASDSHLHRRQNNGEWMREGSSTLTSGTLRAELDTTREVLQAILPARQEILAPAVLTTEQRLRGTLQQVYESNGVKPNAELLDASTAAVIQTHRTHGLEASRTALQLKPDANGRYSADSPIATMHIESAGAHIVAMTTSREIQQAIKTPDQPSSISPAISSPLPSLSKPGSEKADAPDTTTLNKSTPLNHPSNVGHPFHGMFNQATALIALEDEKQGRKPDEKSERLALAATALAANEGMHKIDHMVFSKEDKERGVKAGENVIVVQGGLHDPAHERADMKTQVAISTPVDQSLKELDIVHQRQQQQAQTVTQQQTQNPSPDSPAPRGLTIG